MTADKIQRLNAIQQSLEGCSISESLELIANVFIQLGAAGLDTDEQITTTNIAKLVLEDIERNGENLYNATVRQGLIILSWLERGNNE